MWLVIEVKSNAVNSNIAEELGMLGPWSKQIGSDQTRYANTLGINELKWTGIGEFNSMTIISTTVDKNPLQEMM